jgi:hypothetical protein
MGELHYGSSGRPTVPEGKESEVVVMGDRDPDRHGGLGLRERDTPSLIRISNVRWGRMRTIGTVLFSVPSIGIGYYYQFWVYDWQHTGSFLDPEFRNAAMIVLAIVALIFRTKSSLPLSLVVFLYFLWFLFVR